MENISNMLSVIWPFKYQFQSIITIERYILPSMHQLQVCKC